MQKAKKDLKHFVRLNHKDTKVNKDLLKLELMKARMAFCIKE